MSVVGHARTRDRFRGSNGSRLRAALSGGGGRTAPSILLRLADWWAGRPPGAVMSQLDRAQEIVDPVDLRDVAQPCHESEVVEFQAQVIAQVAPKSQIAVVVELDPDTVERDLMKLVLTVVEPLRQLMERQALRRFGTGDLSEDQEGRIGLTLMLLDDRMAELRALRPAARGPQHRPRAAGSASAAGDVRAPRRPCPGPPSCGTGPRRAARRTSRPPARPHPARRPARRAAGPPWRGRPPTRGPA